MRRWWSILIALGICWSSGCTHLALERRTICQASTVADLQTQQVLDNLAMFACNPNALAWHFKLSGGTTQVTDQGTSIGSAVMGKVPFATTTSLTGQRGVVNQWSGVPTIDPDDLEMLQLAYQKAVNPQDPNGTVRDGLFRKVCE